MYDIQLVSERDGAIVISYRNEADTEKDKRYEVEITDPVSIEVIKVLGRSLLKDSFLKVESVKLEGLRWENRNVNPID